MSAPDPFDHLIRSLAQRGVRYVMIEVWGANYYARHGGHVFSTDDRDLFVPPDAPNLLSAWHTSHESGYELCPGKNHSVSRWICGSLNESFPGEPTPRRRILTVSRSTSHWR